MTAETVSSVWAAVTDHSQVAGREQEFIPHSSGGQGVQDQGADGVGVPRGPASSERPFSCCVLTGWKAALGSDLYKGTKKYSN